MATLVTWQTLERIGMTIVGRMNGGRHMSRNVAGRLFRSHFGCDPKVAIDMWYECSLPPKTQPKHFMWGLMEMMVYSAEEAMSSISSCDKKTFRKWSWKCIYAMADTFPQLVS